MAPLKKGDSQQAITLGVFGVCAALLLVPTVILSILANHRNQPLHTRFSAPEDNACAGKNPLPPHVDCIHVEGRHLQLKANVTKTDPQNGFNVTKSNQGNFEVDYVPNTEPYWSSKMCPVNVHWHMGTEHYSLGEYDENGDGPQRSQDQPTAPDNQRVRPGYRCHHFDKNDRRFTTPYLWQHCINMQVGETYEVHWPHSAAGACGTFNQYQTPFYDGVYCNLDNETSFTLAKQDNDNAVGVQAQVFTIVNDETYFYPDLMRGMIVDKEYGQDLAYYTGSSAGTTENDDVCTQYTPVTWQVDRKCHLISASSFDKLCAEMKVQRDDMSLDLHPHGSRELVMNDLVANNDNSRELHGEEEERLYGHDHHHHERYY